jgi:nicotinate-nucleotide pyrophosphorylase
MNLNRPDMTEDVKSKDYTNKSLQKDSNPVTMKASGIVVPCEFSVRNFKAISDETSDNPPAKESSDQTKVAKHELLVYRVEEIAQLLTISPRAAYNLCNTTKDFRVLRIGTSIRVNKQSFDNWFAAV